MSKSAFVDGLIAMYSEPKPLKAIGITRDGGSMNAITVFFDRYVEDSEMRRLHNGAGRIAEGRVPSRPRFFIDSLTLTGDAYLIPADRRTEWQAFDCQCEETSEVLPVPEWARPIEQLSHLEFEAPQDIFK